jgi:hypothetical protein
MALILLVLWSRVLEEWKSKFTWFVGIWAAVFGVLGVPFSPLLSTNLQIGSAFILVATVPLLVGVWLWVPLVSQKRAESIASRHARDRLKGVAFGPIVEEAELRSQRWHMNGYYVRDSTRHIFSVTIDARCGNLIESGGL